MREEIPGQWLEPHKFSKTKKYFINIMHIIRVFLKPKIYADHTRPFYNITGLKGVHSPFEYRHRPKPLSWWDKTINKLKKWT